MTGPNDKSPANPEDSQAELAAEATQDSTPAKSLYGDRKTHRTPVRQPAKRKNRAPAK